VRKHPRFTKFGRIGQLLILAEYHDSRPFSSCDDIVHFHTNQRIGADPLNLLPNTSKTVKRTAVVRERKRRDVRPSARRCPALYALAGLCSPAQINESFDQ
jgi:hypothetical protein